MSPHCIRKIPERRLMRNMLSKDHLQEWPLLENSNLIALCSVRGLPITPLTIPMITRFKRIPLTIHLIRQKGEINLTLIQKQLNQDLRFQEELDMISIKVIREVHNLVSSVVQGPPTMINRISEAQVNNIHLTKLMLLWVIGPSETVLARE